MEYATVEEADGWYIASIEGGEVADLLSGPYETAEEADDVLMSDARFS